MAPASPSAALVCRHTRIHHRGAAGRAGFLAEYSGLARQAYELDLRQYASWCQIRHLPLFGARRADIECFARD